MISFYDTLTVVGVGPVQHVDLTALCSMGLVAGCYPMQGAHHTSKGQPCSRQDQMQLQDTLATMISMIYDDAAADC